MDRKVVITRIFNAPRERVWKAWTDPEAMKKWWGPATFSAPVIEMDLREGGKYLYCMRGAMGPGMPEQDMWSTGTYEEIIPNEKLVCTDSFADEHGNVVPASYYGMQGDIPLELKVTVELEDAEDGKTKMTLTHVGMEPGQNTDDMTAGWNQSFDKLAESLN